MKRAIPKHKIFSYLWFLLPLTAGFLHWKNGTYNNYKIYKGVFKHLIEHTNLYTPYPAEYFDTNHYGIVFGLVVAPFYYLPDLLALLLWVSFYGFVLYQALSLLPLKQEYKWIPIAICLVDLMTASHNVQVNPSVAAIIVLAWYFVYQKKDFWAAAVVMLGTFVKLYGIVGLAFWVFSKQKINYIFYAIFWAGLLFCLPMLFSSPTFVVQSYQDWYGSLVEKNSLNQALATQRSMQDVSLMGIFRHLLGFDINTLYVIIPAFLLQIAPLLRFQQYKNRFFQLSYLASLLLFVVIFSSSSESSTYIIAVTGVAVWFITQATPTKKWVWALLGFVMLCTSLSATDIFPPAVRLWFIHSAFKALPCCLVWGVCVYQLFKVNFAEIHTKWQT